MRALEILEKRRFHPWEGGEGKVLRQFTRACLLLGEEAMQAGHPDQAIQYFDRALQTPENLGEAYHPLQAKADVRYWQGCALRALGREASAVQRFTEAATEEGDFQDMAVTEHSEQSYFRGMALEALGKNEEARNMFTELKHYADTLRVSKASIEYFATSLPNLLVFEEDLSMLQIERADAFVRLSEKGFAQLEASIKK
jgi:tetratricopeptide (TPR) repeat protein